MAQEATLYCGEQTVPWGKLAYAIVLLEKVSQDGKVSRALKRLSSTNPGPEYGSSFSSLPAYRLVQNTTGMFRREDKGNSLTMRYTLEELVSFLAAFRASRLHDTIYALLNLSSDAETTSAVGPGSLRRARTQMFTTPSRIKKFEVNYDTDILEVYIDFLQHAISSSNSLDIICRPWAPDRGWKANGDEHRVNLPSWIPNLSRKPFQQTHLGDMVRHNPNPLVGAATFRFTFYNASSVKEPKFEFDKKRKLLSVQGFEAGHIEECWDSGSFGNVPGQWLRAGGWNEEKELPPSLLWRTLVADRTSRGEDPDVLSPMVFQSAVKNRGISYGFETHRLIYESTNSMVTDLFRHVQSVVWNRRLVRVGGSFPQWLEKNSGVKIGPKSRARVAPKGDEKKKEEDSNKEQPVQKPVATEEVEQSNLEEESEQSDRESEDEENIASETPQPVNEAVETLEEGTNQNHNDRNRSWKRGEMGLAPSNARVGDLVCIVFGCSVPLVLRKLTPSRESRREVENGDLHSGKGFPSSTIPEEAGTINQDSPSTDDSAIYMLVGECYIDHMMDGEAMAYFDAVSAEQPAQTFVLK